VPLYDFPIWAGDSQRFPTVGIRGIDWKLMTVEVPYSRHGSKAWNRHFTAMRKKYPRYSVLTLVDSGLKSIPRIAPQIIAEAKSRRTAQKAFELLATAICILDGCIIFSVEDAIVVPRDRSKLEGLSADTVIAASHRTWSRDNVILSSKFAAALSRRRFLSYAAFKLRLSYEIASVPWMDLHPGYYPKSFGVSRLLSEHVRMASAITLAYSAIEELQLEPRPQKGGSVKVKGVWDPAALIDIQRRLREARIDLAESIVWTVRGSQTRIHKSDRAPDGSKLSWTKRGVRDRAVKIEDALVAASWLRSKCTTHRYGKQTASISMYDVSNVQNLARRLLLGSTGMWSQLMA
jgi:hypothetical protein